MRYPNHPQRVGPRLGCMDKAPFEPACMDTLPSGITHEALLESLPGEVAVIVLPTRMVAAEW